MSVGFVKAIKRFRSEGVIERAGAPAWAYICTRRGDSVSIYDAPGIWGLRGLLLRLAMCCSPCWRYVQFERLMGVAGGAH